LAKGGERGFSKGFGMLKDFGENPQLVIRPIKCPVPLILLEIKTGKVCRGF
jgi:hypothetical protein